jgi:hypothetical protein
MAISTAPPPGTSVELKTTVRMLLWVSVRKVKYLQEIGGSVEATEAF